MGDLRMVVFQRVIDIKAPLEMVVHLKDNSLWHRQP